MLSPNLVSMNLREWHVGQKVRKGHWLWGSRKDDGTPSRLVSLGILDFPMPFLLNPIGKPRWGFEDGRDGGSGLPDSDGPDKGTSFPWVQAYSWVESVCFTVWENRPPMSGDGTQWQQGNIKDDCALYWLLLRPHFLLVPPSDPMCGVLHSLAPETCLEMEWRKDRHTDVCTEKLESGRLGLLCWSNTS